MKKLALIILLTVMAALTGFGQSAYDAWRFSQNEYEGTARSVAMGNAFTALGGDLGAVTINPAGSAVAGYSQFTITPSLYISSATANGAAPYAGAELTYFDKKYRSSNTDFGIPNIGMTFYFDTDKNGAYKIYDGRIVQARVVAVAEKAIRVEAFGVECTILARDLSWDWVGDAHERFSVGDHVLIRILSVNRDNIETLSIKADVKSATEANMRPKLSTCRVQSKYAGRVTDVSRGVIFIRLTNGINAVAHSCLDRRMPGKKDDVSFAVTHIDEERGVAVGIITRIIKQNI